MKPGGCIVKRGNPYLQLPYGELVREVVRNHLYKKPIGDALMAMARNLGLETAGDRVDFNQTWRCPECGDDIHGCVCGEPSDRLRPITVFVPRSSYPYDKDGRFVP